MGFCKKSAKTERSDPPTFKYRGLSAAHGAGDCEAPCTCGRKLCCVRNSQKLQA